MSGYLIFGGIDSRDYDVFVSFSDIDTVPRRVYTKVDIVGKNGSVLIDEGKYEDVPHSYDCIVLDNEKRVAFVNAIMSKKGYQRLTDSYGTDEYYTAVLEENIEQKTTRIRDKYKFKLIFTRKPQRFLTSGEEPVDTSELGGEVTTDKIPYLFRRSGGGNIGRDFDAEVDKIIGGTVAWNQLCNSSSVTIPRGHKYYMVKGGSRSIGASSGTAITGLTSGTDIVCDLTALFGSAEIADYVYSLEQTTAGSGIAWLKSYGFLTKGYYAYDTGSLVSVKTSEHRTTGKNQCVSIWNNSAATAYDNALLAEIDLLPNTRYSFTFKDAAGHKFYPNENLFVESMSEIVATGDRQIVNLTTKSDISESNVAQYNPYIRKWRIFNNHANNTVVPNFDEVSISFYTDGEITAYEPYTAHSYPLGNDDLRGIFKLSNGNLYADGDVKTSDGQIQRKYSIMTFDGSESWTQTNTLTNCVQFATTVTPTAKAVDASAKANAISNLFVTDTGNSIYNSDKEGLSVDVSNRIRITILKSKLGTVSPPGFKTWLASNNVTVVYELATPTTEQADPYANQQIVSPLGTEEYVDERNVPVPVGHETMYGMSQLILTNPTEFPSKPLLEVTGVGTFWLGDTLFTIMGTAGQTIYIDCETGEAWKNTGGVITPANGLVTLNRLDFPELDPGDTPVMYGTGITKVVVTPRWWRL